MLITHGIIGFVAALTIPALISKFQTRILKTGLNNASAAFSQAVLNMKMQNG